MNPLITIAIPTYNSEKYLAQCLDSVVNQTYDNLEVIIVDGGSTDNTQFFLTIYCHNNKNWHFIVTGKGVSHQRSIALDTFKGKYLYFLDSDDYISPNLIEDLYKKLIEDNLDLVTPTMYDVIFKNNKWVECVGMEPTIIPIVTPNNFFEESYRSFLAGPTKLYKRELLENVKYIQNLQTGEDLLFNYQIVKNRHVRYGISKKSIYYYRQNASEDLFFKKRMNRNSYIFCNFMKNELKNMKAKDKNYWGAFDILCLNMRVYIKAYVKHKKIIPLSLLSVRFYIFRNIRGKIKYFYLFPRLFIFIYHLKNKKDFSY